MSTNLITKPPTIAQRTTEATQHAAEILHATDVKRLAAALAEIALEELKRSPGFALRVQDRYEELAPKPRARGAARDSRAARPRASKPAKPTLVPVAHIDDFVIDTSAPLDPYVLLKVYGPAQLPDALRAHSKQNLLEAIEIVQERHPHATPAPTGKAAKEALVAYIVRHVAP